MLPGQFEQVLQDERVPGGAWTDLLDQIAPPAEAIERPEGNELNEEGASDHVPWKGIRVKAKTVTTEGLDNTDEEVFTIHEEKDHESWRQFHRQQRLARQHEHSHLAKRGVDQEIMVVRLSIPVFEDDVFHAHMDATAFVSTALRRKTTETSFSKMTEEVAAEMDEAKSREWPSGFRKKQFPKSEKVKRCLSQDSCQCVGF